MTIVHCPRCRDEVTVPAKASPKAQVRCPLCLEEYVLAEALAQMPPALEIIGGEWDEEPALVGAGVETAEAGGGYSMSSGGFGGAFDSSAPAGATVSPARTAVKGARPKRKEKSAVAELIKIVLGGVVGISLALVGLWWIGGRDPFKIGPMVPTQIQFIVPPQFRSKPAESGTTVQNNQQPDGTTLNVPPTGRGGSFQPAPGTEMASNSGNTGRGKSKSASPANSLQTLPDPLGADPLGTDPLGTPPNALDPVAPASIDVPSFDPLPAVPEATPAVSTPKANGKANSVEPPAVDFTNLLPEGSSPTPPEPNPPPPGGENAAGESAAALATAVQTANDALAAVEAGKNETKEARQQLFTDLYLAVADAGRVISHLDPADADVADPLAQLKRLHAELVAQPGKVSAFSFLGRTHLPQRKAGEGFAAAGTVSEFRSAGGVFETTLDAGGGVQILIVSTGNPQDFCQVGDQLLATGRIVEEPAKNIRSYQGDAERVMLLGDAVVVPK